MVASGVAEGRRGWARAHNPRSQTDKETEAQNSIVTHSTRGLEDRIKSLQSDSRACRCPPCPCSPCTCAVVLALYLALGLSAETREQGAQACFLLCKMGLHCPSGLWWFQRAGQHASGPGDSSQANLVWGPWGNSCFFPSI